MKTIYKPLSKIIVAALCIVNLSSCGDDESCEYTLEEGVDNTACTSFIPNTNRAGFTVATSYAISGGDAVGYIYDTRFNSQAPLGDDWGTALNTPSQTIRPANWTANDIGQVFGITIDSDENIYLASSHIYQQGVFPSPADNANPGRVYKCSPPLYNATTLFTLPNTGGMLNGTGNIAYDTINDQLLVSNQEDGFIYRYDTNGTFLGSFDPWAADASGAGIVPQEEQVWAVGVNYEGGNVKVYFSRVALAPNPERSIYSVTLNADGSFPVGGEQVEIANVPGSQTTITDIAFSSSTTEILIAERGNPHASKVLSYTRSGSTWNSNLQYFVGGNAGADGENSAGGVDFAYGERDENISSDCDSFFWASGNFLEARNLGTPGGRIYGLQGISYSGNNSALAASPTANQDTDIFIDFNGSYSLGDKNTIGDVETFDASECFDRCNY